MNLISQPVPNSQTFMIVSQNFVIIQETFLVLGSSQELICVKISQRPKWEDLSQHPHGGCLKAKLSGSMLKHANRPLLEKDWELGIFLFPLC